MKKYLFILLLCVFFGDNSVNAQTYNYRAFQLAIKYVNNGSWSNWSDWQDVNIRMKIDFDSDLIIIYSQKTQIYRVLTEGESYTDSSGGKQVKFGVVDQDDDYGILRLRIEKNGNSQIYIEFNDVMWVYNVRKETM